jgi:hypothetical protein
VNLLAHEHLTVSAQPKERVISSPHTYRHNRVYREQVTERTDRSSPDDPPAARAGYSAEPVAELQTAADAERYGPLTVERHRKADGRMLILYERVARDG